jgi:hypothetical protein
MNISEILVNVVSHGFRWVCGPSVIGDIETKERWSASGKRKIVRNDQGELSME